jgi:hypothetical protein
MELVEGWPFARKLEEALKRALPLLGPEARAQVSALLTPQTLGVMATVLVAWVLSHAVGIGEIIDILAVGVVGIGFSVFQGVDELYEFAMGTYKAGTTQDFDVAAGHFAKAVSILGIQAVLAVLLRGAPRTYRGGLKTKGPPTAVGATHRPTLCWSKFEPSRGRVAARGRLDDVLGGHRGFVSWVCEDTPTGIVSRASSPDLDSEAVHPARLPSR